MQANNKQPVVGWERRRSRQQAFALCPLGLPRESVRSRGPLRAWSRSRRNRRPLRYIVSYRYTFLDSPAHN